MKASVFKVAINAILLILISIGCGTGTNLNKLLYVDKEDENRLDHLLSDAQIAYDNGEYQEALNLLEKAEKQSSHSEGVIQLKAFSQLAIGGFDPLSLIGKIVTQTEKNHPLQMIQVTSYQVCRAFLKSAPKIWKSLAQKMSKVITIS